MRVSLCSCVWEKVCVCVRQAVRKAMRGCVCVCDWVCVCDKRQFDCLASVAPNHVEIDRNQTMKNLSTWNRIPTPLHFLCLKCFSCLEGTPRLETEVASINDLGQLGPAEAAEAAQVCPFRPSKRFQEKDQPFRSLTTRFVSRQNKNRFLDDFSAWLALFRSWRRPVKVLPIKPVYDKTSLTSKHIFLY